MEESVHLNGVLTLSTFVGESISNDQTGAAGLKPPSFVAATGPKRDSSTQCEEAPEEQEVVAEMDKMKATGGVPGAITGGLCFIRKNMYNHLII